MAKQLTFEEEARQKILTGVTKAAKAVKSTMGPAGRNVVLSKPFGFPVVTKDGVSVAKEIDLADPVENIGAQLIKEVASKTNDIAGDATTLSTVLTEAIYKEGLRNVTAGANAISIQRGINKAVNAAVEAIKGIAKPVDSTSEISQVATVSANWDSEIGNLIASAMEKVGKDGTITVEEAKGIDTYMEVVEGMQFDKGYLSPYFVTKADTMEAVLDAPMILLYEKKISSLNPILPALELVSKKNRSLFIIAEDIEGEALSALVLNNIRGALKSVAVKAPGFGERRKEIMRDIAALTGATFISDDLGAKLEDITLADFGSAKKASRTCRCRGNSSFHRGSLPARPQASWRGRRRSCRTDRISWGIPPAVPRSAGEGAMVSAPVYDEKAGSATPKKGNGSERPTITERALCTIPWIDSETLTLV